jgi:glucose-6-phosphate 1-dehydrogenase
MDEKLDVGHRGRFYDSTGALRVMVPNHLFQLLSLIAMESPARFDAHNVRSEKDEVLEAIQIQSEEEALKNSVRGQYTAGKIGETKIPDYRKNPDVRPDSTTETYVATKLKIENWRWAGVPFYLRTGKALAMKRTEVAIKFREVSVHAGGAPGRELSCHRHRADRRHHAAVQQQSARTYNQNQRRPDELPLQGLLQGRASDRL